MPSVIFPGPEGRLEGRFSPPPRPRAPVAMILHPHPEGGGTMNDRIVQRLYKTFADRGFATLRFNFRGVGRSQGSFDSGIGELSDAASALDWVQSIHPEAQTTWVAGYSFGALIGMQLLMRRPEVRGFISIAPPANNRWSSIWTASGRTIETRQTGFDTTGESNAWSGPLTNHRR